MKTTAIRKIIVAVCALMFVFAACKKNKKDAHVPPTMTFKTGAGYTAGDATIHHGDTILVGITVTKTEDDLKSYNVSYALNGSTSTTTFYNYLLTAAEYGGYSKDLHVISQLDTNGTERWVFTIVDRDGNVAQKTINLTVN